jgi:hypothetical protein
LSSYTSTETDDDYCTDDDDGTTAPPHSTSTSPATTTLSSHTSSQTDDDTETNTKPPTHTTKPPTTPTSKPPKPTKSGGGHGHGDDDDGHGHGGHGGNGGGHGGIKTTTTTYTKTYTITSCKPTVTNCPYGHVTSEVITTTYICPDDDYTSFTTKTRTVSVIHTAKPTDKDSHHKPSEKTIWETATVVPLPSGYNHTKTGSSGPQTTGTGCTGAGCGKVTTNNGVKTGISFGLMALGAAAVLAL